MAGSIWFRSELGWVYAYCGEFEKAHEVIEQALEIAEAKQPAWRAFPQAGKIRIHLLQGDLQSARQSAASDLFETIAIPYARYTIFEYLANVELAVLEGDHERGLRLADDLLREATPLTRVDIPGVLRWKGLALLGLNRLDEAHQTLTEAWWRAKEHRASLHLLPISVSLAEVNSELAREREAEEWRAEGRSLAGQMAESLRKVGLTGSFLDQPWVKKLMQP
jgi:tetratricopeptide (TPR) repeat protein